MSSNPVVGPPLASEIAMVTAAQRAAFVTAYSSAYTDSLVSVSPIEYSALESAFATFPKLKQHVAPLTSCSTVLNGTTYKTGKDSSHVLHKVCDELSRRLMRKEICSFYASGLHVGAVMSFMTNPSEVAFLIDLWTEMRNNGLATPNTIVIGVFEGGWDKQRVDFTGAVAGHPQLSSIHQNGMNVILNRKRRRNNTPHTTQYQGFTLHYMYFDLKNPTPVSIRQQPTQIQLFIGHHVAYYLSQSAFGAIMEALGTEDCQALHLMLLPAQLSRYCFPTRENKTHPLIDEQLQYKMSFSTRKKREFLTFEPGSNVVGVASHQYTCERTDWISWGFSAAPSGKNINIEDYWAGDQVEQKEIKTRRAITSEFLSAFPSFPSYILKTTLSDASEVTVSNNFFTGNFWFIPNYKEYANPKKYATPMEMMIDTGLFIPASMLSLVKPVPVKEVDNVVDYNGLIHACQTALATRISVISVVGAQAEDAQMALARMFTTVERDILLQYLAVSSLRTHKRLRKIIKSSLHPPWWSIKFNRGMTWISTRFNPYDMFWSLFDRTHVAAAERLRQNLSQTRSDIALLDSGAFPLHSAFVNLVVTRASIPRGPINHIYHQGTRYWVGPCWPIMKIAYRQGSPVYAIQDPFNPGTRRLIGPHGNVLAAALSDYEHYATQANLERGLHKLVYQDSFDLLRACISQQATSFDDIQVTVTEDGRVKLYDCTIEFENDDYTGCSRNFIDYFFHVPESNFTFHSLKKLLLRNQHLFAAVQINGVLVKASNDFGWIVQLDEVAKHIRWTRTQWLYDEVRLDDEEEEEYNYHNIMQYEPNGARAGSLRMLAQEKLNNLYCTLPEHPNIVCVGAYPGEQIEQAAFRHPQKQFFMIDPRGYGGKLLKNITVIKDVWSTRVASILPPPEETFVFDDVFDPSGWDPNEIFLDYPVERINTKLNETNFSTPQRIQAIQVVTKGFSYSDELRAILHRDAPRRMIDAAEYYRGYTNANHRRSNVARATFIEAVDLGENTWLDTMGPQDVETESFAGADSESDEDLLAGSESEDLAENILRQVEESERRLMQQHFTMSETRNVDSQTRSTAPAMHQSAGRLVPRDPTSSIRQTSNQNTHRIESSDVPLTNMKNRLKQLVQEGMLLQVESANRLIIESTHHQVIAEFIEGNIFTSRCEYIVSPANSRLANGGGLAREIEVRTGVLEDAREQLRILGGELATGNAILSGPGRLENFRGVIHTVGPRYAEEGERAHQLLIQAHHSTFHRVLEADGNSVALPVISCGIFGYPPKLAGFAFTIALAEFLQQTDDQAPFSFRHVEIRTIDARQMLEFSEVLRFIESEFDSESEQERATSSSEEEDEDEPGDDQAAAPTTSVTYGDILPASEAQALRYNELEPDQSEPPVTQQTNLVNDEIAGDQTSNASPDADNQSASIVAASSEQPEQAPAIETPQEESHNQTSNASPGTDNQGANVVAASSEQSEQAPTIEAPQEESHNVLNSDAARGGEVLNQNEEEETPETVREEARSEPSSDLPSNETNLSGGTGRQTEVCNRETSTPTRPLTLMKRSKINQHQHRLERIRALREANVARHQREVRPGTKEELSSAASALEAMDPPEEKPENSNLENKRERLQVRETLLQHYLHKPGARQVQGINSYGKFVNKIFSNEGCKHWLRMYTNNPLFAEPDDDRSARMFDAGQKLIETLDHDEKLPEDQANLLVVQGPPGTGKTSFLQMRATFGLNQIVAVTPTRALKANLSSSYGMERCVYTPDEAFLIHPGADVLMFDEVYLIGLIKVAALIKCIKPKFVLLMGDLFQISAYDGDAEKQADFLNFSDYILDFDCVVLQQSYRCPEKFCELYNDATRAATMHPWWARITPAPEVKDLEHIINVHNMSPTNYVNAYGKGKQIVLTNSRAWVTNLEPIFPGRIFTGTTAQGLNITRFLARANQFDSIHIILTRELAHIPNGSRVKVDMTKENLFSPTLAVLATRAHHDCQLPVTFFIVDEIAMYLSKCKFFRVNDGLGKQRIQGSTGHTEPSIQPIMSGPSTVRYEIVKFSGETSRVTEAKVVDEVIPRPVDAVPLAAEAMYRNILNGRTETVHVSKPYIAEVAAQLVPTQGRGEPDSVHQRGFGVDKLVVRTLKEAAKHTKFSIKFEVMSEKLCTENSRREMRSLLPPGYPALSADQHPGDVPFSVVGFLGRAVKSRTKQVLYEKARLRLVAEQVVDKMFTSPEFQKRFESIKELRCSPDNLMKTSTMAAVKTDFINGTEEIMDRTKKIDPETIDLNNIAIISLAIAKAQIKPGKDKLAGGQGVFALLQAMTKIPEYQATTLRTYMQCLLHLFGHWLACPASEGGTIALASERFFQHWEENMSILQTDISQKDSSYSDFDFEILRILNERLGLDENFTSLIRKKIEQETVVHCDTIGLRFVTAGQLLSGELMTLSLNTITTFLQAWTRETFHIDPITLHVQETNNFVFCMAVGDDVSVLTRRSVPETKEVNKFLSTFDEFWEALGMSGKTSVVQAGIPFTEFCNHFCTPKVVFLNPKRLTIKLLSKQFPAKTPQERKNGLAYRKTRNTILPLVHGYLQSVHEHTRNIEFGLQQRIPAAYLESCSDVWLTFNASIARLEATVFVTLLNEHNIIRPHAEALDALAHE